MEMAFEYGDDAILGRPVKFYAKFGLFIEEELVQEVFCEFENADHNDLYLGSCPGDGVTVLYYVYGDDEKFKARKTCDVSPEYRHLFTRPSPVTTP